MSTKSLDLNSDCGESYGNWRMGDDGQVIPRVTSANLACGFHAGDPLTLLATVGLAVEHGVAVGAHPGLPDRVGFGRRPMTLSPDDAYADTVYQIGALQAALRTKGAPLRHVKPHGCLMAMVRDDAAIAEAVASAVADVCEQPCIYFTAPLEGACLPRAAASLGVRVVAEVYPDLAYDDHANVVIERAKAAASPEACAAQLQSFLEHGRVRTTSGRWLTLEAESACVHGDAPNAPAVIDALRKVAEDCGVTLSAPTGRADA